MKSPKARLLLFCALACAQLATARGADGSNVVAKWLAAQTNMQTWSADLVQTRTLKTIAEPLRTSGKFWFSAPNRFHWQLGEPPQTVAIRDAREMVVLYPKLKRAEKYPLTDIASGPMRDLMTLIEAGFPRSQADLDSRFKVLSVDEITGVAEIRLEPKSSAARKFMPELKVVIDAADYQAKATELKFADGSTMRNDFTKATVNPKLDEAAFSTEIPAGFKVTEPLKPKANR